MACILGPEINIHIPDMCIEKFFMKREIFVVSAAVPHGVPECPRSSSGSQQWSSTVFTVFLMILKNVSGGTGAPCVRTPVPAG